MKTTTIILTFLGFSTLSFAQIPVDTMPHNKNVLLEEYTGVTCTACPQGHIEINNLIATYPNKVFAAGLHSASVGHTTPYGNDENLARTFPDLLRPKIFNLFGIPGGIINRRMNNGGVEFFIFNPYSTYHSKIDSAINTNINEASPFNIGIVANYDTVNKILYINSQTYTTINKSSTYKLHVFITQSNILVSQLDGSTVIPNYNQKHVFREIITPTWGATLYPTGTTKGDIFNSTVTYSNSAKNYKMQDVEVLVFITDNSVTTNSKGQIVQVMGAHVNMMGTTAGINENANSNQISIYPNPSSNQFFVHLTNPSLNNEVIICDINGKVVLRKQVSNENNFSVNHELAPGVYFLSVKNNPGVVKKLVVQ